MGCAVFILCLLQFHSEYLYYIVLFHAIMYYLYLYYIVYYIKSYCACKMSTSGIKIAPLVPAEEVPHGKDQDWLMEYAGE